MIRFPALPMVLLACAACMPAPTAALLGPTCVLVDAPVFLDARGSSSRTGPLERYRFDFGDGTPAVVGPNATQLHRYGSAGRYETALTVTDRHGNQGSTLHALDVVVDAESCGGLVAGEARIQVSACRTLGVEDCSVDFGATLMGTPVSQSLTITNVGNAPLKLTGVGLEPAPGAFQMMPVADVQLQPGTSLTVDLTFSPTSPGRTGRKLFIPSNAANNPANQGQVTVSLEGVTAQTPFPRLTVAPLNCDFGTVDIDATGTCILVLTNTGTANLTISALNLTDADHVFRLFNSAALPWVIPPQGGANLTVAFTPQDAVVSSGLLAISSNDDIRPLWPVTLRGTGLDLPPVPIITVDTINGHPVVGPNPPVAPLDDVVLSGEQSMARRTGRTVAAWSWELSQKPEVSRVTLSSPSARKTGFAFDNGGQPRAGLDVSGTYVIKLNVTDSQGLRSTSAAVLTLSSTNTGRLHVELTWMDDHSDMDLHLVRNSPDNAFSMEDCYFSDCTQGNQPPWSMNPDARPSLDVDATTGFGPENITLVTPQPATYLVGVHYYDGHGDPNRGIPCRVKVFVDGATVLDESRVVSPCNAYWEVARVVWGPSVTVTASGVVTQQNQGACSNQVP